MPATEIIFEIKEDEVDEIRRNVREAVDCYFGEGMPRPPVIRLHFVRDEVLAG